MHLLLLHKSMRNNRIDVARAHEPNTWCRLQVTVSERCNHPKERCNSTTRLEMQQNCCCCFCFVLRFFLFMFVRIIQLSGWRNHFKCHFIIFHFSFSALHIVYIFSFSTASNERMEMVKHFCSEPRHCNALRCLRQDTRWTRDERPQIFHTALNVADVCATILPLRAETTKKWINENTTIQQTKSLNYYSLTSSNMMLAVGFGIYQNSLTAACIACNVSYRVLTTTKKNKYWLFIQFYFYEIRWKHSRWIKNDCKR